MLDFAVPALCKWAVCFVWFVTSVRALGCLQTCDSYVFPHMSCWFQGISKPFYESTCLSISFQAKLLHKKIILGTKISIISLDGFTSCTSGYENIFLPSKAKSSVYPQHWVTRWCIGHSWCLSIPGFLFRSWTWVTDCTSVCISSRFSSFLSHPKNIGYWCDCSAVFLG